jgi:myo-inositol-1(or 4)-monophosphatase
MLLGAMNDVDVAIAVVEEGAEILRRQFGTALERIEKGAGDFATTVDIDAEAAMLAVLRRERPDDAVLAEESGRSGASDGARLWLVDPLCGTLNYAAGMPLVAVNAALSAAGAVLAAAVAEPFAEELFWTDGRDAYVRTNGRDAPLVPSANSKLVDLNLDPPFPNAPTFRAAMLPAEDEFLSAFKPRVVSTSLALTWVATGQRAAYITDGDVRNSVHFAAGLAICQAAGCSISDLGGHLWGVGPDGVIVAADQPTHAAMVRLARKQRG